MTQFIIRSIQCKCQSDVESALDSARAGTSKVYSTPVTAESAQQAQTAFSQAYEGQAVQMAIMTLSEISALIDQINQSAKDASDRDAGLIVFSCAKRQSKPDAMDLDEAVKNAAVFFTVVFNAPPEVALARLNANDPEHWHFGFISARQLREDFRLVSEHALEIA